MPVTRKELIRVDISPHSQDMLLLEEHLRLAGNAGKTIASYLSNAKIFFAWETFTYGNRDFHDYKVSEIQEYLRYLDEERHCSGKTINVHICMIRKMFHFLRKEELSKYDVPTRRTISRLPNVPSREEVSLLLAMAQGIGRLILIVLLSCGLRISEAAALHYRDIDRDRMTLYVAPGKGRRDRYIPITESFLDELTIVCKQYRRENGHYPGKEDYIFSYPDGTARSTGSLRYHLKKLLKEAHLGNHGYACHSFRHFWALMIYTDKSSAYFHDIACLSDLLGHRTLNPTLIYLQMEKAFIPRTERQLLSPLDLILKGES